MATGAERQRPLLDKGRGWLWTPCCPGSSSQWFQGFSDGILGTARQVVSLGSPGPSPRPEPQHPGEGLLGAGVDEVGAGRGAEGLPVPAAKGWKAVHRHEAFVPLPPVERYISLGMGYAHAGWPAPAARRRGAAACTSGLLPHLMAPTPPAGSQPSVPLSCGPGMEGPRGPSYTSCLVIVTELG